MLKADGNILLQQAPFRMAKIRFVSLLAFTAFFGTCLARMTIAEALSTVAAWKYPIKNQKNAEQCHLIPGCALDVIPAGIVLSQGVPLTNVLCTASKSSQARIAEVPHTNRAQNTDTEYNNNRYVHSLLFTEDPASNAWDSHIPIAVFLRTYCTTETCIAILAALAAAQSGPRLAFNESVLTVASTPGKTFTVNCPLAMQAETAKRLVMLERILKASSAPAGLPILLWNHKTSVLDPRCRTPSFLFSAFLFMFLDGARMYNQFLTETFYLLANRCSYAVGTCARDSGMPTAYFSLLPYLKALPKRLLCEIRQFSKEHDGSVRKITFSNPADLGLTSLYTYLAQLLHILLSALITTGSDLPQTATPVRRTLRQFNNGTLTSDALARWEKRIAYIFRNADGSSMFSEIDSAPSMPELLVLFRRLACPDLKHSPDLTELARSIPVILPEPNELIPHEVDNEETKSMVLQDIENNIDEVAPASLHSYDGRTADVLLSSSLPKSTGLHNEELQSSAKLAAIVIRRRCDSGIASGSSRATTPSVEEAESLRQLLATSQGTIADTARNNSNPWLSPDSDVGCFYNTGNNSDMEAYTSADSSHSPSTSPPTLRKTPGQSPHPLRAISPATASSLTSNTDSPAALPSEEDMHCRLLIVEWIVALQTVAPSAIVRAWVDPISQRAGTILFKVEEGNVSKQGCLYVSSEKITLVVSTQQQPLEFS